MKPKPYLSIIMTSRNDDYQGEFFKRMQTAINSFIGQAKRYKLNAELIVVEWNPPEGTLLLKDALTLPDDLGSLTVRFIAIPSSIHKRHRCSPKVNIIWTAALNVGIRRAKGEFILVTNSDILFSDELINFLSQETLERKYFYRTTRYDVHRDIVKCSSMEERLRFCRENIVGIHRGSATSPHGLSGHPVLHSGGPGDFLLLSKIHWHLLHGLPELNNLGTHADGLLCYMAYLAGLKEKVLAGPVRVYHIDHTNRWKRRAKSESKVYHFLKSKIYNRLDANSKLKILIKPIYNRSRWLLQNLSKPGSWDFNGQYWYSEFRKVLVEMLKGKRSYIYNDDNWGLPKEDFKEYENK